MGFRGVPETNTHNLAGRVVNSNVDTAATLEVAVDLKGHNGAEPGESCRRLPPAMTASHGGISVKRGNQDFERFGIFMRLGGADSIGS